MRSDDAVRRGDHEAFMFLLNELARERHLMNGLIEVLSRTEPDLISSLFEHMKRRLREGDPDLEVEYLRERFFKDITPP